MPRIITPKPFAPEEKIILDIGANCTPHPDATAAMDISKPEDIMEMYRAYRATQKRLQKSGGHDPIEGSKELLEEARNSLDTFDKIRRNHRYWTGQNMHNKLKIPPIFEGKVDLIVSNAAGAAFVGNHTNPAANIDRLLKPGGGIEIVQGYDTEKEKDQFIKEITKTLRLAKLINISVRDNTLAIPGRHRHEIGLQFTAQKPNSGTIPTSEKVGGVAGAQSYKEQVYTIKPTGQTEQGFKLDISRTAASVYPNTPKGRARWSKAPNRADVTGIDTKSSQNRQIIKRGRVIQDKRGRLHRQSRGMAI